MCKWVGYQCSFGHVYLRLPLIQIETNPLSNTQLVTSHHVQIHNRQYDEYVPICYIILPNCLFCYLMLWLIFAENCNISQDGYLNNYIYLQLPLSIICIWVFSCQNLWFWVFIEIETSKWPPCWELCFHWMTSLIKLYMHIIHVPFDKWECLCTIMLCWLCREMPKYEKNVTQVIYTNRCF